MKAPCSTVCKKDIVCKIADYCPHWREYITKLREERRCATMKCPKCRKEMQRKEAAQGVYYYECPSCHHELGKPREADSNG